MNPASILSLIVNLYEQIVSLQAQVDELEGKLAER